MSFSDTLHISRVQIRAPEDEDEWAKKLLNILLSDFKGDGEILPYDNPGNRKGNISR